MQRRVIQLLAASLLLLLALPAYAQLKVFACEPEWAALVTELGGDKVDVFSATHAGQDPHYVQARPSLIARLRNADLAVCSGAELESGWMPMLQRRARNPQVLTGNPGYFSATDHVELLGIPDKLDRAEGHIHTEGNPHIQLDPRRILEVARALSVRLQTLDPSNADYYEEQLSRFTDRWENALLTWKERTARLKGKRVIVHHQEWLYLLDWLDLQQVGSLEPKPGVPPNFKHLASLKQLSADMVIISPRNDRDPAEWLNQQTGISIMRLPQTVGAEPGTDDLFSWFDVIVERLTQEINSST